MNPELFRDSPSGVLALTERSQFAFVPDPLPPKEIDYSSVLYRLSNAATLVGQLAGTGRISANPYLLVRPLQRKEAVASSSMEGTHTTLSQLFLFEIRQEDTEQSQNTKEVHNYVTAMENAIAALDDIPISTHLFLRIHADLLNGLPSGRGGETAPGQYKRAQNYIGGLSLESARFVPAPPSEVGRLMGELENFINTAEYSHFPPLLIAALAHYQFETIHPFADGNGRVGRVLIPLILQSKEVLQTPLLYVSPYLEENKDEYIERLYAVSERGEWMEWIDFFLRAVEVTCRRTIKKLEKLHDINLDYLNRVQESRNSALLQGLISHCFETPFITIPLAQKVLGVTYHSAKNNIQKLLEYSVLEELNDGKRPRLFFAREIFNVVSEE